MKKLLPHARHNTVALKQ